MRTNKVSFRVIDICYQLIYILISGVFFVNEIKSWRLTGDAGIGVLIVIALFIGVNIFFFFIQLLAVSIKWKKIIFIFHNVCLFGLNFYLEIQWSMTWIWNEIEAKSTRVWDKTSPWIFYIILFVIGSYLLYDYLLSKITGSQEPAILDKLIFNRINRYFPNEEKK